VVLTVSNYIDSIALYWFTDSCGTSGYFASGEVVIVNPLFTTSYYARYFANNVWGDTCAEATITVQSPPTTPTSITGAATICYGDSTVLTAEGGSNGDGAFYQWFADTCGGTVLGTDSFITVSPVTTTAYYVRRVANTICSDTTSCVMLTITVRPTPEPLVSGSTTVCQFQPEPQITFTNPHDMPVSIYYNVNGGTNVNMIIPADTFKTVNVSTDFMGTFVYNLVSASYTTAPSCSNTLLLGSESVTVHPPLPGIPSQVTGVTPICPGVMTTYSIDPDPDPTVTYNWTVPTGWVILSGNGTPVITVTTGLSGEVIVHPENNCGPSQVPSSMYVTVHPPAPQLPNPISGATVPCPELHEVYVISTQNMLSQANCVTPGLPNIINVAPTSNGVEFIWEAPVSPAGSPDITYYWMISKSSAPNWNYYVARCSGTTDLSGNMSGISNGLFEGTPNGLTPNTIYYIHLYAKTSCDNSKSGWVTQMFVTKPAPSNQ